MVDGNNWEQGYDDYRSDHPVMQFVGYWQRVINQNPHMTRDG